ncbi:lysophospholipase L1-like esterase [Neobacillus niacini]|uniref:hypothetical protein n=1 Tax=Neobacillus niacini TaxID=86668 RepID=UPI00285CE7A2|nr:hypothetical protein [Neobacillus niacini]MDR7078753.1 lysophospholipase L1-like esterase [Neobacillus niacini]
MRVRNLAVPGWKTINLLNALNNDQKFIQAVSKADYITLNIGSNDLLKPIKDAFVASGGNLDAETIVINNSLETLVHLYPGLVVANAYEIGLNPLNNLIPGDIHPSLVGHKKLAQIGLEALGLD